MSMIEGQAYRRNQEGIHVQPNKTIDRNRTDRSNNLGKIMSHEWGEIKYDPKMHAADY